MTGVAPRTGADIPTAEKTKSQDKECRFPAHVESAYGERTCGALATKVPETGRLLVAADNEVGHPEQRALVVGVGQPSQRAAGGLRVLVGRPQSVFD